MSSWFLHVVHVEWIIKCYTYSKTTMAFTHRNCVVTHFILYKCVNVMSFSPSNPEGTTHPLLRMITVSEK